MKLFANATHNFATTEMRYFALKRSSRVSKRERTLCPGCVRIAVYFVLIIVPTNIRIIIGRSMERTR